jgi:addiction module HigA family antidote
MSITTKILLNKSRQKNDGTYPLIVRSTYHRKVINFPLEYSIPEKDWDAKNQRVKTNTKISNNVNRLNNYIQKHHSNIFDKVTKASYSLAKSIGVDQTRISQLIKGKRSFTADTALRLSKFFGTSAEFWLNAQSRYDLEEQSKHNDHYNNIAPYKNISLAILKIRLQLIL